MRKSQRRPVFLSPRSAPYWHGPYGHFGEATMNEQQHPGRMTPCLEAGQLMAWHDGALLQPVADEVQAHLTICPRCAAQERALVSDCQQVFGLLTSLDPPPATYTEPDLALARFQQRLHAQHTGTFVHDSNGTIPPG